MPTPWIKFKSAMCKTCWASCCHNMPVQVSVRDLVRLELVEEEEAALSLGKVAKRLKAQGIIQAYKPKQFIFVLEQKKNLDCVFLDEKRRCTVYSKRPEICRQFPKIGPKPGHCPYLPKSTEGP